VLLRPEVERDGGEFVDQGVGETIFREVDCFDVGPAGVAALHPNVREFLRRVDRKFGVIFLAAAGTDEAAELPLGEAESAEQAAAASVPLLAEDAERRLAIAERAERRCVAFQLQIRLRADKFGVWLKKSEHEEFLGIGGGVEAVPDFDKEAEPGVGVGAAQFACDLG
jgi:hypothetical protein